MVVKTNITTNRVPQYNRASIPISINTAVFFR